MWFKLWYVIKLIGKNGVCITIDENRKKSLVDCSGITAR